MKKITQWDAFKLPYLVGLIFFTMLLLHPLISHAEKNNTKNRDAINASVINFAKKAAVAAFTYGYKNYEQDLQQIAAYFTPDGWVAFQEALADSKNLETIEKHKLNVSAKLKGDTKIINQTTRGGKKTWIVETPITVTYLDQQNEKLLKQYIVKMVIISIPKSELSPMFGIQQLVARPTGQ